MVLGAGLGSRLKPFTTKIPKPLIPVLGIPCIEFALRALHAASVNEVVVNLHAHADQMRKYLKSNPVPGVSFQESDEEALLLGSAGGFRKALPCFQNEAFLSMNADVIHDAPILKLIETHERLRKSQGVVMTLVLAGEALSQTQSGEYREIFVNEASGLITGFGEKKSKVPFYTGTAVFEPEAFSSLVEGVPAEFVPEVLEPWIKRGKVGFLKHDSLWLDIGSAELWRIALETLAEKLKEGDLPPFWLSRLKSADPTLGGRFELGKNHIRLDDIDYEA